MMDFNALLQYISNMPKNQLAFLKKVPTVSIFCGLSGILTGIAVQAKIQSASGEDIIRNSRRKVHSGQIFDRILRGIVHADFKMQMRSGAVAGASHMRNQLSPSDNFAGRYVKAFQMAVAGNQAAASVINLYEIPIAAAGTCKNDLAGIRCINGGADGVC